MSTKPHASCGTSIPSRSKGSEESTRGTTSTPKTWPVPVDTCAWVALSLCACAVVDVCRHRSARALRVVCVCVRACVYEQKPLFKPGMGLSDVAILCAYLCVNTYLCVAQS